MSAGIPDKLRYFFHMKDTYIRIHKLLTQHCVAMRVKSD
jgi:hypothetical protein